MPNPDLKPEKSTQFEIGARYRNTGIWSPDDSLSFAVSAYNVSVEDYIDSVVTFIDFGLVTPGREGLVVDGSTRTRNIDARLWGLELEADYDADSWFVGGNLSLARGETDDGDPLGSIPQDRLSLNFGVRPSDTWELSARATFAAEQDDVPDEGTPGDAYELLDLYATWTPDAGALDGATIRFGVDNVFDEQYTIYPNGLAQGGRNYKISASFVF